MDRSKKIIFFLLILLLIFGGYLFFRIYLYKGIFLVQGIYQFNVNVYGYGDFFCGKGECRISLPPGDYNIAIQKEGFYSLEESFQIDWKKTVVWQPELKKIPSIEQDQSLEYLFQEEFTPMPNVGENPYAVREDGVTFFYDLETGNFYKGDNNEKQFITNFTNLNNMKLYAGQENIYLYTDSELFSIDPVAKRKFRIFSGTPIKGIREDHGALFLETDKGIYYRYSDNDTFALLPMNSDIDLFCKQNDYILGLVYAFAGDQINSILYKIISPENTVEIFNSSGAKAPKKIHCLEEGEAVLLLDDNQAYKINY